MDNLDQRVRALERITAGIPSRFAGGGASAPAAVLPWVSILAQSGNSLIVAPGFVYGVKRFAGTVVADTWKDVPRRATATCTILAGLVNTVTVTDAGLGYLTLPVVTVSPPPVGVTAILTPTLVAVAGSVEAAFPTACGTLYTVATVAFTAAPGGGVTATGTVTLRNGLVVGITITNKGRGYLVAPTPTITGDGVGAVCVSILGQSGITLAITNPGSGYVAAPTITIAAPALNQPIPLPPTPSFPAGVSWPDGLGWGIIGGGSLTGGLAAAQAALICHDDRSLVPYGLMGLGATIPFSRPPDSILSWYLTLVRIAAADANADGVLPAWVPQAGGV